MGKLKSIFFENNNKLSSLIAFVIGCCYIGFIILLIFQPGHDIGTALSITLIVLAVVVYIIIQNLMKFLLRDKNPVIPNVKMIVFLLIIVWFIVMMVVIWLV